MEVEISQHFSTVCTHFHYLPVLSALLINPFPISCHLVNVFVQQNVVTCIPNFVVLKDSGLVFCLFVTFWFFFSICSINGILGIKYKRWSLSSRTMIKGAVIFFLWPLKL